MGDQTFEDLRNDTLRIAEALEARLEVERRKLEALLEIIAALRSWGR